MKKKTEPKKKNWLYFVVLPILDSELSVNKSFEFLQVRVVI